MPILGNLSGMCNLLCSATLIMTLIVQLLLAAQGYKQGCLLFKPGVTITFKSRGKEHLQVDFTMSRKQTQTSSKINKAQE